MLRKLELRDAPYMLEWMHDEDVTKRLKANFADKTIRDCEEFIKSANFESESLHLAITNDSDEYMGTVSLKHIENESAEFAITVRKCAMGKGLAKEGMKEIINIGFKEKGLKLIYWCVDPNNIRAVRFYNKNGYSRTEASKLPVKERYSQKDISTFIWYKA